MRNGAHPTQWLFGYGSLIFRADFPFLARRPAWIRGWERRFWQGSHDHRGTPRAPGRVVTLTRVTGAVCAGMAYRISRSVFTHLDEREKNGYRRTTERVFFDSGSSVSGTVYIASEHNPAFLGAAPEPEIAAHIARAAGPSGHNSDYLKRLAEALRGLDADDPHVFALDALIRADSTDKKRGPEGP